MDVSGGLTLVETLLKTLGSPIWTEIESILGVESELVKLKKTITTIQAVLLDADQQQLHQQQRRSHVERDRLERLKDALYQADDLFDEIATLAHRKKLLSNNKVSGELRVFFSCSNQLRSAYNWCQELERIREMLDDIVKDHRFELVQRHPVALEPWRMVKHDSRETHSYCEVSNIIGREDDKKKVIDMLLGSTSVDQNVSVISIVGIGGLGKTSLAQFVYNDPKIKTEFPLRMWVCVSDDFNVGALLQQIIVAAKNQTTFAADEDDRRREQHHNNDGKEDLAEEISNRANIAMKINLADLPKMTMDQLQSSLGKVLDGKKYLLVLDDIWNEDRQKWHDLSVLLERGGSGSKIIVTTRSNGVADVVGSRKIHELGGLSEDDSWKLFERIAFKGENNKKEDDLVTIGKEILCKCRNVPLAIRVVGSLLRGQDRRKWEYIKSTGLVNIKQDDNGILHVLKISYYHLPFHLKSCFSYCAVFPKDYRIMKDDLIRFWMAQGFVMPLDGQSLEDAGDEYFNHLLQRCFFQDVEKDELSGVIISCKMHDLIHDVAKEVASTEILSSNNSTSHFNERTRHFFIDHNTIKVSDDIVSSFNKMKRMRSLLSNGIFSSISVSPFRSRMKLLLSEVRYLRVLDLSHMKWVKVPRVIGELIHLRYLDLSANYYLTMLPESITNLYNLQTLKLRDCSRLKTLPRDLSKLVNLRDLDIFNCRSLRYMPPGMDKMTSLQKLTRFVMRGTRKTSQWRSHCVGELVDLVNFTNHADILQILVRKFVSYDAFEANICGNLLSKHLREIEINWEDDNDDDDDSEENTNAKVSLEGLESCHNLSKIYLRGNLRLEHLPPLHHLRHLKFLVLTRLWNLKCVDKCNISEDGAKTEELIFFPSLEELRLIELPQLKGWWKRTSESDSGKVKTETSNGDKKKQKVEAQYNQLTTTGMHFNSYSFPRLTRLEVHNCPSLTAFPWGPNLKYATFTYDVGIITSTLSSYYLEQGRMRVVDIKGGECLNYVPLEYFHCLSDLTIRNISLESLPRGMVFSSDCLCSLCSLTIKNCHKLKRLSWEGFWEHCTALVTLYLDELPKLELEDEEEGNNNNRHGDEGEIRKEVTPWRFLSHSLRKLTLSNLPKLEKLPNRMRHLTSLQSLVIYNCENLMLEDEDEEVKSSSRDEDEGEIRKEATPWRFLSHSLRRLELEDEEEEVKSSSRDGDEGEIRKEVTPWRFLSHSLRNLLLAFLPKLEKLPNGMRHLTSLQSLEIYECENLKSMSEEMRHLTSLQQLALGNNSTELNERCKKPSGADWPNIQHIPKITIEVYTFNSPATRTEISTVTYEN